MRYITKTWGSPPRRRHWIAGFAIALLLALTLACGQQAPAAAPQVMEVDSGAAEAAALAKADAEQALAAAAPNTESAEVAAQALAAAERAQMAAEAPRRGEDRPIVSVIGSGSASVSASASGSGTGSVSGAAAMPSPAEIGGLLIPTGLSYETDRSVPTKSDGYY